MPKMIPSIKPWLSQAEAQRLLCELADANLDAAQRKRERDILQHALDEATAHIAELEAALRPFAEADDPNRVTDSDLDVVARILFEFRYYRRARDAIRARPAP